MLAYKIMFSKLEMNVETASGWEQTMILIKQRYLSKGSTY